MAFTPYEPNDGYFHKQIQLPDDDEMKFSGIGAFNTPIQQVADNAARANANIPPWTGEHRPEWSLAIGRFDETLFSLDQWSANYDVVEIVMHSFDSTTTQPAQLRFDDCRLNDIIQLQLSIVLNVIGVGNPNENMQRDALAFIRIFKMFSPGSPINKDISSVYVSNMPAMSRRNLTVFGTYCVKSEGTYLALVGIGKKNGPCEVHVIDELRFSATRWRAVV